MSKTKDKDHYRKLLKRHKKSSVLLQNEMLNEITSYKNSIVALCLEHGVGDRKKITITQDDFREVLSGYGLSTHLDKEGNLHFEVMK